MRSKRPEISYKRIRRFPTELLSQKLYDGLEAIRRCDFEEVLLHDGGIPDSFKTDDNYASQSISHKDRLTVILPFVKSRCL